jgi:cytoskeletal protein RodZ
VGSSVGGYTYELYGFSWSVLIEFLILSLTFLALVLLWIWQRCFSNKARSRTNTTPDLPLQDTDSV